ncbi:pyridoxamine 5'-phosphate oxidase family protein [Sinorhizobium fredii]|uniref:GAF domain-containing protein n=1 Tax=Rhizobium fredii TaxID=380 RepID=A0A844A6U7_RHIFR|nr:pyridoxamine 5'-phosphate oxidase family protein [Sinorhizobium fredii]ASY73539.1 Adenylate cyclase [Sinorhizobium fredii CCBAU 83666]AWM29617.1 Adenylate cyclase [Sinorhizobium fredii CCBAU 25509]MQW98108.1 GAF domain-containing protein [Sinorhizobium fredii]MQX08839.1 GAF domain-containing protein [Sinorhizobium fredii]UTY47116.1 GAF domain-containing protein [Sinorhizobium fredii]
MTLSLLDLEACFEGVVPSIIATADGNGVPNISYLSHVARVDDEHVALSNQFFGKTSANIRMNPRATLIVVDASNGAQFRLELTFAYSLDAGPLFDHLSLQLDATSAQVGMAGVMRLRGLDVFRVLRIEAARSTIEPERKASPQRNRLAAAAHVVDLIAAETDAEGIVDATLNGLKTWLGFEHGLFLALCEERQQLVTIGSLGYAPSGIGSEVEVGDGVIGAAAASGNIVKVSDMSRIRRFNAAVRDSSSEENRTRSIVVPGMPDAMSQIAVPLAVAGIVRGALFFESRARLVFTREDETALSIIALHAALALAFSERTSEEAESERRARPSSPATDKGIHVAHHRFDDSVFIDSTYVIKGVAGRLLAWMLEQHLANGRSEFTNREIRLDGGLRLPDFKDNLETRLLLLRRRLEEKALPIRLVRLGRGRIAVEVEGRVRLSRDGV